MNNVMGWQVLKNIGLSGALVLLSACGSGGSGGNNVDNVEPSSPAVQSSSSNASLASSDAAKSTSSSSSIAVAACLPTHAPVSIDTYAQPTLIEAEAFDMCSDKTSAGGVANSQIDILAAADASDGFYIGQTAEGEYTEYSLAVDCGGLYNVVFTGKTEVATNLGLTLLLDDQDVGSIALPVDAWGQASLDNIYLSGGRHRLRVHFNGPGAALDTLSLISVEDDTQTASDIVQRMGTGINLGNTLDEPAGQNWGAQDEEEHYFDDFKKAGFGHVRLPVTWGGHTGLNAPYTIEPDFLKRVEKTVDWALERGLYVIINAHHEKWFKENYPTKEGKPTDQTPTAAQAAVIAENNARLEAIWTQVAEYFKAKPKRLVFEILNEPFGMTTAQVDDLNPRLLAIIRASNPSRAVVFSGAGYTPYNDLIAAKVPEGSHLIANFHSYDPWGFAGQCVRRWGSASDKTALRSIYQQVADWAGSHSLPATVNEFGAAIYDFEVKDDKTGEYSNYCNAQDRKDYLRYHVELQKEFGIAGTVWDDDGAFRIYDRKTGTWDAVINSLVF